MNQLESLLAIQIPFRLSIVAQFGRVPHIFLFTRIFVMAREPRLLILHVTVKTIHEGCRFVKSGFL